MPKEDGEWDMEDYGDLYSTPLQVACMIWKQKERGVVYGGKFILLKLGLERT